MAAAKRTITIVDRHAWYDPQIEREALAPMGIEVRVGWTGVEGRPRAVDAGPTDATEIASLSRITSGFVPPSITTPERVVEMARDADGILVVRADINAAVMDALPRLKVIGRCGIGLDNIDTAAAAERGIAIVYAPGFCSPEVADHTMAMLLACARKLEPLHRKLRDHGVWGRDIASPMTALRASTVGLVGFGAIGQGVAERARAFGMRVVAADPAADPEAARRLGVELVTLDELLPQADYLSLHLPLLASTKHLIDASRIARMKPTAFVINTSRGPLIDEAALIDALSSGRLGGAALDVFEQEPLPASSPLKTLDNVMMSPHIGGLSNESQVVMRRLVAESAGRILCGRWPAGPELFAPRDPAGQARARAAA